MKAFGFPLFDEEANSVHVHDRICYVCIGILQWWVFAGMIYVKSGFIYFGGGRP